MIPTWHMLCEREVLTAHFTADDAAYLLGIDRVTEPVCVVTDLRQCLTRTSTHGRIRLARDPQADAGGRVASEVMA